MENPFESPLAPPLPTSLSADAPPRSLADAERIRSERLKAERASEAVRTVLRRPARLDEQHLPP